MIVGKVDSAVMDIATTTGSVSLIMSIVLTDMLLMVIFLMNIILMNTSQLFQSVVLLISGLTGTRVVTGPTTGVSAAIQMLVILILVQT